MAGGRDCYSLETRGHRDNYRIKDVDDSDGSMWGEMRWKRESVPEVLYAGWDEADVLRRWEDGVQRGLVERGFLGRAEMEKAVSEKNREPERVPFVPSRGNTPMNLMWGTSNVPASSTKADEHRKKAVVKLSADAGRFLCEYALFESLSQRWLDAERTRPHVSVQQEERNAAAPSSLPNASSSATPEPTNSSKSQSDKELAQERIGKVAFLHVPGWTGVEDINRGVMVAEEAIRAIVSSWEEGYRRHERVEAKAYTQQHSEEKWRNAASWKA